MKKILFFMLGVLMALPSIAADRVFTYEYEGQTLTYYVLNENAKTCRTLDGYEQRKGYSPGNNVSGTLVIPSVVKDGDVEYTVTEIGAYAFAGCSGLTSVTIPNSVTAIREYAFAGCSGLTSVTIPNSVTAINQRAFYNCTAMKTFTIEDGESLISFDLVALYGAPIEHLYIGRNWSYSSKDAISTGITSVEISNSVTQLPDYAFYNCSGLTSVTIPNSVNSIGSYAFFNCSGLTSLTIPNSVTEISTGAFYRCSGLTSMTIPNSVNSIGSAVFSDCSGLTSVTIPNSVTEIGSSAFNACSGLTSVTIPNSVNSIGSYAFYNCSGLKSVTIPNSVNSIGDQAFYSCSGLTSVIIPNSVNSIGDQAFYSCSGLTSVIIPNSVTEIGSAAFNACSGLIKSAYPSGLSNPFSYGVSIQYPKDGAIIEDGYIYGLEKNTIYFAPLSIEGEYALPTYITKIGDSAFRHCSGLTSVTIPNSVTSIGEYAFSGCSGLKTFTVEDGENLIAFGNDALSQAPIEHLYIGRNWSNSSKKAISTGITSVEISNSVTQLPDYAFYNCSGLTSVTIPNSVNSIGGGAFYSCSGLTSVTIPNSVIEIGNSAFSGCSGLTSVTIPNSVNSIGYRAFYSCTGLKTFTVEDGESLIAFGTDALSQAPIEHLYIGRNWSNSYQNAISTGITSVEISNSVTQLPNYAFYNCSGLKSVTIPNSVNSIGSSAFSGCSGMTSVIIPNSVNSIGSSAFNGCSGLTSVTIPNSVTAIGSSAFNGCSGLIKSAYPSGLDQPFSNGVSIQYPKEGAIIEDGIVYGPEKNAIYFVPYSLEGGYDIPDSVTKIGAGSFYSCPGLTSVKIPNSVTSIGDQAFNGCSGMTSVTIPNSVTEIGSSAFNGCSDLTDLVIEDSDKNLHFGEKVFESAGLSKVYLGRNFDYEGQYTSSGPFYNSKISELTISSTVTKIAAGAFHLCESLTSVEIPNSVTAIGNYAFNGCSGLTSVTIPNSVTEIGNRAFYSCTGLKTFTVEDGESLIAFGNDALSQAPIEHLYIGRNWSYSSQEAISTGITSVEISNSVTQLPDYAFYNCSGLKSVTIPNSVNSIGFAAFDGCSGMTSVIIPNSVNSIGSSAFSGCSGLTSVTIPNSVTAIGSSAFNGCSGMTSVIIPNSVNSIGFAAFDGCSGLKKSAYPSGLSNPFSYGKMIEYPREGAIIEDGIVYGPEKSSIYFASLSLEGEYVIPESVTSVGENAFLYCSGLTSVTAQAVNPPIMNDNSFEGLYATVALSVPEGAANDYLATNWSLFENLRSGDSGEALKTYETGNLKYKLIPGKTDADKNLAVVIPGDYSSLTEVTIPERFTVSENGKNVRYYVDGIGFKAFNGCSNLATITFNSRNASRMIGEYAFAGTKIAALSIPETVETIGNHAFDGCKSLTSIAIPKSVKIFGNYAFSGCAKLNKVEISEGVPTIGDYAFNRCTALTEITVPGSVESIGDYAFNRCTALTNANLEAGVKTIGDCAFYDTSALKEVTLNEGLESIGASAFSTSYGESNVSPLYIPSTLKSIGADAFYRISCEYVNIADLASWCDIDFAGESSNPAKALYLNGEKIENLVIPESVNAIKDYAFRYNSGLKSVKFNDALQSIGESAFGNCSGLAAVVIPGNVTAIGTQAFASTGINDIAFAYGAKPIEIATDAFPTPTTLSWDRPAESLNLDVNSLESLTIGNSLTEIPAAKFKGISTLTSLTLGNSLTAIGDEAFSGCTALTEVILPPSVETIGASAFAGNSKLTSIIMGHKVTSIGEKAYDLCPAQTVSITAQTPPEAPDNTFSNYTGNLYVQGQEAADAYYDADFCWYQFEGHVMIEPTELKTEGDKTLSGKPGDTFQLTATLMPENVTLPHVFWRSTNPDIATVDANGLVTLHADMSGIMTMAEEEANEEAATRSCKIIAESLYANGPVAEFTVNDVTTGVDEINGGNTPSGEIDINAPVQVYNLQGVMVSDSIKNLASGIYIVRQGKNVRKIAVR